MRKKQGGTRTGEESLEPFDWRTHFDLVPLIINTGPSHFLSSPPSSSPAELPSPSPLGGTKGKSPRSSNAPSITSNGTLNLACGEEDVMGRRFVKRNARIAESCRMRWDQHWISIGMDWGGDEDEDEEDEADGIRRTHSNALQDG